MSLRYTKGPWEVVKSDKGHNILMGDALTSPYMHDPHLLINYKHYYTPDDKRYADVVGNLSLIVNSPDMYELLTSLEWSFSTKDNDSSKNCCPVCGGEQTMGHSTGCRLGNLLSKIRGNLRYD